jgi:hypothetical protein
LITTHYVNSPVDKPDQWVLREDQLTFMLLKGHHTRANMALIIASVLDDYGISGKVSIVFMPCIDVDALMACSWDGSPPTMHPTMTRPSKR